MLNLTKLRIAAREIFDEALSGVDARAAVRQAIHREGSQLKVCGETIHIENRRVYSIAIGKAAFGMACAIDEIIGANLAMGVITTGIPPPERARGDLGTPQARMPALPRWQAFQGGHPEPNEQSLAAAQASFTLLECANAERALVVFLISGGGSAMIEWPIDESITLADLRAANKSLVSCGASISEINAVRRAASATKGGRLAARAPACDQISLIISDVPSGEERNVASGPTLAPPGDGPSAREIIERYGLSSRLPQTILGAIETESKTSGFLAALRHRHFVLLDNHSVLNAATAAAEHRGFLTEIADDVTDQPIEEGCARLLARLETLQARVSNQNPVCLISGGEFSCPVRGDGLGGRNLETALRLVYSRSPNSSERFTALCAGTDGIDGNSPAAGAIVDGTTIARARAIGLDPADFIARSDAYSFFIALGDVIATGPTGTNVRDIRILLGDRSQ